MNIPAIEISQSFLNSFASGVALLGVGFLITAWWKAKEGRKEKADGLRRLAEEKEAAVKSITDAMQAELDNVKQVASAQAQQLAVLTANISPISRVYEMMLMKNLTNSHKPEMDALLVKAEAHSQTPEEHARLLTLLAATVTDPDPLIGEDQREDATILPYVMKRASRATDPARSELMVVVVPRDFKK